MKKFLRLLLALLLCITVAGCQTTSNEKKKVVLNIKTPPIGVGNIPGVGEQEIYDLFQKASKKFQEQYKDYTVEFQISKYNYQDEEKQIADKYGTDEATDIIYAGSWNIPSYIENGWMVELDDILDDQLKADIDEKILEQNSVNGHLYTMPFQQLQNTLMVNKTLMKKAGLEKYIPSSNDEIAHWSIDEFNIIINKLKKSMEGTNQFPMMMYAANNQGDNHILTLLRAYGCDIYDKNGRFAVNSKEGIQALKWISEWNQKGMIPKGAENMELIDNLNLFHNQQLAICVGNLTNLWDSWNKDVDVFAVNFPSLDGKGYVTGGTNGFCIFDNKNEDKIKVAKDFIRFIYTDDELMKYTLGTQPVNHSITDKYKNEIRMIEAYDKNEAHYVDNVRNNLNWQGVRDVFHVQIRDMLLGVKTPEETAKAIDEACNAALDKGIKKN